MYIFKLHMCAYGYKTFSRYWSNRKEDTSDFRNLSKDTRKKLLISPLRKIWWESNLKGKK